MTITLRYQKITAAFRQPYTSAMKKYFEITAKSQRKVNLDPFRVGCSVLRTSRLHTQPKQKNTDDPPEPKTEV